MTPDKLTPSDSRVQHQFAVLNGQKYHYLLADPSTTPRSTTSKRAERGDAAGTAASGAVPDPVGRGLVHCRIGARDEVRQSGHVIRYMDILPQDHDCRFGSLVHFVQALGGGPYVVLEGLCVEGIRENQTFPLSGTPVISAYLYGAIRMPAVRNAADFRIPLRSDTHAP